MTRKRSLTHLELSLALNNGRKGWVAADWQRADGSKGSVIAHIRPKTPERWYIAQLLISVPSAALLRDVPFARIEQAVNAAAKADPKMREWLEQGMDPGTIERMRRDVAKRPRLKRPANHRLDDEFYERVATAYQAALEHGLRPSKTLAEDSDTPPGTVNRWIFESRSRGYLPAAEPGKVTA
jgi:hypothetical protein